MYAYLIRYGHEADGVVLEGRTVEAVAGAIRKDGGSGRRVSAPSD